MDYFSEESNSGPIYLIVVAVTILAVLYLYDLWCSPGASFSCDGKFRIYGYDEHNGPSLWKNKYISAGGCRQSPINLQERCAIIVPSETVPPLVFSKDFHTPPFDMKIYNNGHTAVVCATWCGGKRPVLSGGPLEDDYNFLNIRFRWGPNDDEGSEHMINSTKFAMELQVAFIKCNTASNDVLDAAKCGSLLILSYVFLVTPRDNPYMEPIVNALRYVKCPSSCISIEPVILSLLMPDFSRDYFAYTGSLSFPPCTEGVKWIVKPEPLMISSSQVRKFRKLNGYSGSTMLNNTRPVQKINNRDLFYYD